MNRRKFIKYVGLAGTGLSLAACTQSITTGSSVLSSPSAQSSAADNPLKAGFIYVGPVKDGGWSYAHDLGRQKVESSLRGQVMTSFAESVSEGADVERVLRQFASTGHRMIVAASFGYMESVIKIAKEFPEVAFFHQGGYKQASNVATYKARFEEPAYLTGMIAGQMTQSNIIGYVGGYPVPAILREMGAFALGVRAVNPQAVIKVVWAQVWYDPAKEREAAVALAGLGADVLTQNTNSTAIVQFAEEKGIYAFGHYADMSEFGPKAHLTAPIVDWGSFYTDKAKQILSGNWQTGNYWLGIQDGITNLAPMNDQVPDAVKDAVNVKREEFATGKARAYDGTVKDQSGRERVPAGQTLSDEEQLKMDWFVEGIEGSLS
ncbi:BMP family ABC transporter substrate-binding protein [Phormidium tenue FACHB-886]|nr:BMP family ABC transporter substrate-binding protein [Phormidium tenue FACHB-886]